MKRLRRILIVIVALELAGGLLLLWQRSPAAPPADLSRLDSVTRSEIERRQQAIADDQAADWTLLGDAYLAYGYFPQADFCYRRADRLQPNSPAALVRRGVCFDRLGRTDKAIEQFRKALEHVESGDADMIRQCWCFIGRNQLRNENAAEAEQAFRSVADAHFAQYELSKILVRSDRAAEAIPILDELLETHPYELKPLLLRARAAESLGHVAQAAEFRDRALRATDQFFQPLAVEFSRKLRNQFGLVRAIDEWQQFGVDVMVSRLREVLDEHSSTEWVLPLSDILLQLRRPDDVVEMIESHAASSGFTPATMARLGDARAMQGKTEEARQLWERAVRLQPTAQLHEKLADLKSRADEEEPAVIRHRALARHHRGVALFRGNQLAEALRHLERAVGVSGELDHTWYYLGETHRALDQREEAEKAYRRCLELNPDHGRAIAGLARLRAATNGAIENKPTGGLKRPD